MFWENTEKCRNFSVPIKKKIIKIGKDGNESILTIVQDLRQFHHQILLMILHKQFIKLNVEIVIVFLKTKVSRTIQ